MRTKRIKQAAILAMLFFLVCGTVFSVQAETTMESVYCNRVTVVKE